MNFLGSLIFLFSLIPVSYSQVVFLSGKPSSWQKKATEDFLFSHHINTPSLVKWDSENKECKARDKAILQLCFKNDDIFWIKGKPEILRRTFAELVANDQKEEKGKTKNKRPSNGEPI